MAYSIDRIIPININLTAAGLQYANFVSVRAFATAAMLADAVVFDVDTYRSYDNMSAVADDFATTSDVYYMAQNWFGQTPKPGAGSFTVWMRDDINDATFIDTLNKAEDAAPWAYTMGVPVSLYQNDQTVAQDIASWGDENGHMVVLTFSDTSSTDENTTTDIPSALYSLGARHVTQKYRSPTIVSADPKQAYAGLAEMAYFQRFNPAGTNTSVDPEFKALTNVVSEGLKGSQYTALENRLLGFYTLLELKGEQVRSRVKNSWTTSSYGETVDDVFSIDVLTNYLQVDLFNYMSRRKRGLRRPRDYAGAIAAAEAVARQFNINGTLAEDVIIEHPETGEDVMLENGYLMLSKPEDVSDLTDAQVASREYPGIDMIIVLARSARVCRVNVTVE